MWTRTAQRIRYGLRRHRWVDRVLRTLGVKALGRRVYDARVVRRGEHELRFGGAAPRFRVSSSREIARIDALGEEERFLGELLHTLKDGDVFFDVGANIGLFTLCAATLADRPGVSVHAFEPEPVNRARLADNVALNELDARVTIHPVAVGREAGTATLHVLGAEGEGQHTLVPGRDGATTVEVPLIALDAFVREHDLRPDVVKIDVEGAEWGVLQGMEGLLSQQVVRDLLIEFHPGLMQRVGPGPDEVDRWLVAKGYGPATVGGRRGEVHMRYTRTGSAVG